YNGVNRLGDFVGYRGGEFAEHRDARDMGELGLRFARCLLGLLGAGRRRHIAADATIAAKMTVRVMEGLAAGAHVNWRSVAIPAAINQIAKRKVGIERRAMLLPLLGLEFGIGRNVPKGQADQAPRRNARSGVFRYLGDTVIGPGLPKPVRRGFGIVAEPLLGL